MSEADVIGKLAKFTPNVPDRNAMLFAAGRASVRPSRVWKWAAAALVVSNLLTLGLWLQPTPDPVPPPVSPAIPAVPDDRPLPPADPYSLLALKQNPDPRPAAGGTPDVAHAPLLAFSRNYQP